MSENSETAVTCDCGHTFTTDRKTDWCDKCGKRVFKDPKDKRRHKYNQIYYFAIIVLAVTFIGWVFLEMLMPSLG